MVGMDGEKIKRRYCTRAREGESKGKNKDGVEMWNGGGKEECEVWE